MGTKRVEGKKKQKSIKAKVTSKFSSKRLLSRMGKKVKKGEMGPNTDFITRSAVLKKLQVTLKDFRRLCILKGIYPRVPSKAPKGADKVYYDIKDISYLSHEPLLVKFREFKTFMKKIRKAAGRNQFDEARRKDKLKPIFSLDHLVKERYPRFIDALRDMDDTLCMIHLFAAMPSLGRITAEKTSKCNELVRHWQYYIVKSKTLQKVFVSVKGIYFQAEIMGESITWLAPHQFTQSVPKEVDLRVMLTFLEFYEVFMKFTLFKLYHMQGLRYPPVIDKELDDFGCHLLAVKVKAVDVAGSTDSTSSTAVVVPSYTVSSVYKENSSIKPKAKDAAKIASLSEMLESYEEENEEDDDEDDVPIAGPLSDAFAVIHGTSESYEGADLEAEEEERRKFAAADADSRPLLFHRLKFFANREVPLDWVQICTLAMGAQVGWEGPMSPFDVNDPGITHHVVDRPIQGIQTSSREYVQPQWIFDSINAQVLLPVHRYRPGAPLPPHLSPFVDDDKAGYLPKYREEIKRLQAAGGATSRTGEGVDGVTASRGEKEELGDDEEEEVDDDAYAAGVRAEKQGKKAGITSEEVDDDEEVDDEEEEEEEEINSKKGTKGIVFKPVEKKLTEAEEAEELARIMMSKKTKRLYGRMQHGIEQKQDSVRRLEEKRKAIELQENAKDSKKASPSPGAKKAKSAEEKQHHGKSSGVASKVETQKTSIKKKK